MPRVSGSKYKRSIVLRFIGNRDIQEVRDMIRSTLSIFTLAAVITLGLTAGSANAAYMISSSSPLIPTGMGAGDSFQLVFQTSTPVVGLTGVGDPAVIGNWNTHVTNVAGTSGLADIPSIAWYAILSTPTVDAKDNAVVSAPVYLLDSATTISTLIASDATDMWDGSIGAPITYDENANLLAGRKAWSGGSWTVGVKVNTTESVGGSAGSWYIGVTSVSTTAFPNAWLGGSGATSKSAKTNPHAVYAMSEVITVVPEPASLASGLLGLTLIAGRRRR
jgi:hypothetical protein